MTYFSFKNITIIERESVSDSGGNSWLAEFLVGSWVRFRCVTNDFIRYIPTASTLGSGEVSWLKTFVKARAAAGAASS